MALGMWHVPQGVLYSGTQSGLAEVTHLTEALLGRTLGSDPKAFLWAEEDHCAEPREALQHPHRGYDSAEGCVPYGTTKGARADSLCA